MSFILDALRKSEAERQREAAPSLAHAPLATIRREAPAWTWLVIGSLALALAALAFAWWRDVPNGGDAGTNLAASPAAPPPLQESAPARTETSAATTPAAPAPAAESAAQAPPEPRPIAELAALDPSLPELRLEFLAFDAAEPAASSAWINGAIYRPGDRVANGPELVEVRSDRVILAHRGQTFVLRAR